MITVERQKIVTAIKSQRHELFKYRYAPRNSVKDCIYYGWSHKIIMELKNSYRLVMM